MELFQTIKFPRIQLFDKHSIPENRKLIMQSLLHKQGGTVSSLETLFILT